MVERIQRKNSTKLFSNYRKMSELQNIRKLIESKKLREADLAIKKLGSEYLKNSEYLILRAIMFKIQKNYYLSIDTLLIASEFDEKEEIYQLLSEIYSYLENDELAKKLSDKKIAHSALTELKNEMSGIYRK
tara:strand:+ start:4529 stop:4924 length:396 start_codon:yes stop_codon:yes gene_type:complete